jgi:hypothetical protein
VAVTGYFDSNGNGRELSTSAVFWPGRTPVVGRFSLTGGNPNVADAPMAARGLGLAFGVPGQQQWRTAMLNLPVFLDNSPQGFVDRVVASKVAPDTGALVAGSTSAGAAALVGRQRAVRRARSPAAVASAELAVAADLVAAIAAHVSAVLLRTLTLRDARLREVADGGPPGARLGQLEQGVWLFRPGTSR